MSPQVHYDFGLRSIKSVLTLAGAIKRENYSIVEEIALIQALRANNAPKFLPADLPLFNSILTDLFPGVKIPPAENPDLHTAILSALQEQGLQQAPSQIEKILQLYETLKVRHGAMLVGPTGGGKTTIYQVLAHAQCLLEHNAKVVNTFVLNPKSLTINELYGVFDEYTRDWSDGLVANIVRNIIEDDYPESPLKYEPFILTSRNFLRIF